MIGNKDFYKTIYIIYHHQYYEDIKFPEKGLRRYDFGLPYIEEKTLTEQELIKWIGECHPDFVKESVFDDKYEAYKAYSKELEKKSKWISNLFKDSAKSEK